ncbi:response regulator [Pseudomonas helleri]|uniref:Response regulator n=1 Tax=Pseudomonas helleri TaxID=1608996 RepID=A0A6A7YUP6_9PSED|nr:response regulator [Pseudomonas helleri]MQT25711.1 response regulator [Pseudomonas helleri]MQT80751.1 response regulator [Pseudomonas helleri]MQU16962.1 response regulator [Pseudomonas helleri]MQU26898.1 response regulator [Pseudomonas helleri]
MPATASTILVVEDDSIVRMLIVDVLEELEFNVIDADCAEEALISLENLDTRIDLLMTDFSLPGFNGQELAAKARQLRQDLPVLVASGLAETLELSEGVHLIGKPFSINQLRDKVTGILDSETRALP